MNKGKNAPAEGTYGYDVAFLAKNEIPTIELKDREAKARVLLVPDWQGRVMTSSACGEEGLSFGWLNYKLIGSKEVNPQFNPFGGEERFWLGPEGGPYSLYFEQGEEQVYANWNVPPALDTEGFDITGSDEASVTFAKKALFKNAAGTEFNIGIDRRVSLLSREDLCTLFGIELSAKLFDFVAYKTENTITNVGANDWTKEGGLVSIWMLGMFKPSPSTTVMIPYKTEAEGAIVKDDYFGVLPEGRLIAEDGMVLFRIDGKLRSKIGIPPHRATEFCGSYDSASKTLTIMWYSLPSTPGVYVNSQWGSQDNPYDGDVINSYNDGPLDDGSIMGPFYEIETSSAGAALKAGESLTHTQAVMHIQGNEKDLARIANQIFHVDLHSVKSRFNGSHGE